MGSGGEGGGGGDVCVCVMGGWGGGGGIKAVSGRCATALSVCYRFLMRV